MRCSRISGLLVALALVCATVPASAQSAKTLLSDPAEALRFNDISDRLVCQCGCQMMLRVCNHQNCPSGIPMRRSIEAQIQEGKTDDEIVAGFVEQHGLKILSSPPAEGLNLAVWIMPGFAILVGLFFIFHFAGHWMARRRLATASANTIIDPELLERMEREMSEMER